MFLEFQQHLLDTGFTFEGSDDFKTYTLTNEHFFMFLRVRIKNNEYFEFIENQLIFNQGFFCYFDESKFIEDFDYLLNRLSERRKNRLPL